MLGFRKEQSMIESDDPHDGIKQPDPRTVQVLESIVSNQRRVEELTAENVQLRGSLAESERQVDYINRQLVIAERKRDMFQRHAVALYTRLVDLLPVIRGYADVIERALADARVEATSGGAEPEPKPTHPTNLDEAVGQFAKEFEERKGD